MPRKTLKKAEPVDARADAAERIRRLVELTMLGWSAKAIATALDIHPSHVSNIRATDAYREHYGVVLAEEEEQSRQARQRALTKAWRVIDKALESGDTQTARWLVDHTEPGPEQRVKQDTSGKMVVEIAYVDDVPRSPAEAPPGAAADH
jgi:glycerol-3-phosphate cytidylyltransferase-like family protein